MISPETLAAAVETGVITADQARGMLDLESARTAAGAEPQDDERLRFISGFGDVFVTLGLALFLAAAAYFLFSAGSGPAMWPGLAVLAWLLAEFFSRVRRMALPSIVLLLVFALSVFAAVFVLTSGHGLLWSSLTAHSKWDEAASSLMIAGAVTAAATALHYLRFKVPITVAAGTAALACSLLAVLSWLAPAFTNEVIDLLVLLVGLGIFALAMHFDRSDPHRVTRRTDIAFWLHLMAAPLIVHPLVSGMLAGAKLSNSSSAVAILALFAALGAVAVLIDRRALLVSGLMYAGVAFASLLRDTGLAYGTIAPATMLALGAFVLLLSAGWRPLRASILTIVPPALAARLHPASGSHT